MTRHRFVPGDVARQPCNAGCDGGPHIHVVPSDGDLHPAGDQSYLWLKVDDPQLLQ